MSSLRSNNQFSVVVIVLLRGRLLASHSKTMCLSDGMSRLLAEVMGGIICNSFWDDQKRIVFVEKEENTLHQRSSQAENNNPTNFSRCVEM